MNLSVFAEDCAGQTMAPDPELGHRNLCANPLRTRTVVDDLAPVVTFSDKDCYAESLEKAPRRLGDPVQRLFGVARSVTDRAQDVGARGLAITHGAQFSLQPGILLAEIGRHVRAKRGHSLKSICGCLGASRPTTNPPVGPSVHGLSGKSNRIISDYPIPGACGPARVWWRLSPKTARAQVPGLDTSVSLEVMNSSSTGMPSLVFWMPR
jgi:hypothetical protein